MEVTTSKLFELIGRATAQNELLKDENAQLRRRLAELEPTDG